MSAVFRRAVACQAAFYEDEMTDELAELLGGLSWENEPEEAFRVWSGPQCQWIDIPENRWVVRESGESVSSYTSAAFTYTFADSPERTTNDSELHFANEALRRDNYRLSQQVESLTREVRDTKGALRQAKADHKLAASAPTDVRAEQPAEPVFTPEHAHGRRTKGKRVF